MNVVVALEADRATLGALMLEKLAGTARITADAMRLEPISFGVLRGRYTGSLVFALGDVPDIRLKAALTDVDVATATTFAGSPGAITGRMSAKIALTSRGMDASSVMKARRLTLALPSASPIAHLLDGMASNVIGIS